MFLPEQRYQSVNDLKNALKTICVNERIIVDFGEEESKKKNSKFLWLFALIPVIIFVVAIAVISSTKSTTDQYPNSVGDLALNRGERLEDVTLYFGQDVYISEPDERQYYTFVPEKTGYYDIYSDSGILIPVIWLSDEDDNLIAKDNTMGEYTEFSINCKLQKGITYYIETTLYDMNPEVPSTGIYWIYIEYVE